MKKILFALLFSSCLIACSQNNKRVVSTYENGNPNEVHYSRIVDGKEVLDRGVFYYETKEKKLEGYYKDSVRHGVWKAWHIDGSLWSEGQYNNGVREGYGNTYYQNGNRNIEGWYKNDMPSGVWTYYDSLGKVIEKVDYDVKKNNLLD